MVLYLSSSASTPNYTFALSSEDALSWEGVVQRSVLAVLSIGNRVRTLPFRVVRLDGIALWIVGGEHTTQSIVRYPSTDVGVGRLDSIGVGTP